ncbi:C39 family peptidase [Nocardioides sp. GY 10127]|uniref:C39 family peptidase n=1 Tax=Nocardioides sp. GY 10127 TaxID=2569762 RepID=UPI0010A89250|nr:C39 family peptidase [Nocardioides sp. GY 10127]TIC78895.1 peptidase C39 family protein [Nocardioides sp. GY 10127]
MRPPRRTSPRRRSAAPGTRLLAAGTLLATALVPSLVTSSGASPATASTPTTSAARATATRHVLHRSFDGATALRRGTTTGATVVGGAGGGAVVLAEDGTGTRTLGGTRYDVGRWVSPWRRSTFGFTELVASWRATTPGDSLLVVQVRGRDADGTTSSWDTLARWTSGDAHTQRTTLSSQSDDLASVNVDTWVADDAAGLRQWQLRVSLLRRHGATSASPRLQSVGAVVSRLPAGTPATSAPGVVAQAGGTVLAVPRYSQMIHAGDYPEYGGGGESWCSPTSLSMVLAYYDALPPARHWAWVTAGHRDPWVDDTARRVYDHGYDGAGNWPFNTAYAAGLTGTAYVTRLKNLRAAERLVAAGIPVVISIAFAAGELTGAPISASNGHLLVVVGFRANGDVVVNDPAAQRNRGVRRTYDRGQLEAAWLDASGGTAYVVADAEHPVPAGESFG